MQDKSLKKTSFKFLILIALLFLVNTKPFQQRSLSFISEVKINQVVYNDLEKIYVPEGEQTIEITKNNSGDISASSANTSYNLSQNETIAKIVISSLTSDENLTLSNGSENSTLMIHILRITEKKNIILLSSIQKNIYLTYNYPYNFTNITLRSENETMEYNFTLSQNVSNNSIFSFTISSDNIISGNYEIESFYNLYNRTFSFISSAIQIICISETSSTETRIKNTFTKIGIEFNDQSISSGRLTAVVLKNNEEEVNQTATIEGTAYVVSIDEEFLKKDDFSLYVIDNCYDDIVLNLHVKQFTIENAYLEDGTIIIKIDPISVFDEIENIILSNTTSNVSITITKDKCKIVNDTIQINTKDIDGPSGGYSIGIEIKNYEQKSETLVDPNPNNTIKYVNDLIHEIERALNDPNISIPEYIPILDDYSVTNTPSLSVNIYEYASRDKRQRQNNLTNIDLGDCEAKLLAAYNLSKLYIVQIDYFNVDNTNNYKFKIYSQEGKLLNLSICDDIKITANIPIKEESYKVLENIRFANNSKCIQSRGDKDMLLSERRYFFLENISLCYDGCEYKGVDSNSISIICECDGGNIISDRNNTFDIQTEKERFNKEITEYTSKNHNDNFYEYLLCFDLIFKNIKKNGAFFIYLVILIINILNLVHYLRNKTNIFYRFIFQNPVRKNKKKANYINNNNQIIPVNSVTSKGEKLAIKQDVNNKWSINDMTNLTSKLIFSKETSFSEFYFYKLRKYHPIFRILNQGNDNIFNVVFFSYIFKIQNFIFVNCLLYNANYIIFYKNIEDNYSLGHNLVKIILSYVFGIAIGIFPNLLIDYISNKDYYVEKNGKKYSRELKRKNQLDKIKIMLWIFYTLVFVTNIIYLFFTMAFCSIYPNNQHAYIIDSFITVAAYLVLPFITAIIGALMKKLVVFHESKLSYFLEKAVDLLN